jgi:type IV pilus assembly protein PilB
MPLKKIVNKILGELLVERHIITPEQLRLALSIQREKGGLIGEILVEKGFAREADIAQALTAQYGFPYLPLDSYEITPEIIKLIPEELAREYLFIPVDRLGNSLSIAMSNPLNNQAIEKIEALLGCNVQMFVATSSDIRKAIDKYYKTVDK